MGFWEASGTYLANFDPSNLPPPSLGVLTIGTEPTVPPFSTWLDFCLNFSILQLPEGVCVLEAGSNLVIYDMFVKKIFCIYRYICADVQETLKYNFWWEIFLAIIFLFLLDVWSWQCATNSFLTNITSSSLGV